MLKVLVIVNAKFGYDGISNVATNYYIYQNHNTVKMDLLTINSVNSELMSELTINHDSNYVVSYRNRNPIKYILTLRKIIKQNQYNIVHVHGNSATMFLELLAAKLAGVKVRIAHIHCTRCDHKIINKILMPFFTLSYTDCCACSREAGKFIFGKHQCKVISNGLNIDAYLFNEEIRDRLRKELNINNQYVIGHIGRYVYQKNHDFIIDIFFEIKKKTPDALLLLIGEGDLKNSVREKVSLLKLNDSVIFYGTTNKVNEFVQAMDAFVFPSKSEGLGIVAIEAQTAGIPCFISDIVPEQVKVIDDVRFISLSKSPKYWADKILQQKGSCSYRREQSSVIADQMKKAHFDIKDNCKEMEQYYRKLVKERYY